MNSSNIRIFFGLKLMFLLIKIVLCKQLSTYISDHEIMYYRKEILSKSRSCKCVCSFHFQLFIDVGQGGKLFCSSSDQQQSQIKLRLSISSGFHLHLFETVSFRLIWFLLSKTAWFHNWFNIIWVFAFFQVKMNFFNQVINWVGWLHERN